jgi:peptide/nickel transport system substrate-binding protein
MNKISKYVGVVVLGASLALSGLINPALAAEPKTSITVAETTAGGGGVNQISNPWFASGSISHGVMFRALFKANADLASVKPDLASGYKVSKDGKTVTITLKSGLKWSDDVALTADDVIWSMNTLLRTTSNAIYSSAFKQIVGGTAVTAANTTTISGLSAKGNEITISLLAPQNTLIPVLGQFMILPKHKLANEDLVKFSSLSFWRNPVTSGPFKVGTFSQGNFITLVPNDKYEGAKPKITEINIVTSTNLSADAKAGKLDYFTTNDAETIKAMAAVSTYKANAVSIPFYRYFVFNLLQTDSPFKSVKAREALKYAVDWNRLIPAIYPKLGKVINSGVFSGMPNQLASIPKYKFDKAKAIALLKEADFDFSKTIRLRHYYSGAAEISFMSAIAQQLTEVGMKVEMLKFQGDATTELWSNLRYDVALKGLSAFNVGEWYGEYSNTSTFKAAIGDQPVFAALNAKLLRAVTFRDTRKVLTDLQKLEQEFLYKLPLHSLQQYVFVSKRIGGAATKWGNPLYVYDNKFADWVLQATD